MVDEPDPSLRRVILNQRGCHDYPPRSSSTNLWRCDLSFRLYLHGRYTPLEDLSTDRAIVDQPALASTPGFNIFVTGLTGTGKTSIIKVF
jgi:Cdc6-like AAA superfamily ATPase